MNAVWISLIMRRFFEQIRLKEINSRILLGNEIVTRENIIKEKIEFESKLLRDASVGLLTNQVLHDLKSPLTALNILKTSNNLPVIEKELLNGVHTRINEMLQRTGHNLPVIQQGASDRTLKTSLNPVFLETTYICTAKNVELVWKWPDSNPSFNIDHVALARVISNLVQNSLTALNLASQRKLKVEISVSNKTQRRMLSILVSDNGIGINELRWQTGERASTTGSTGMGLSYVSSFAVQNEGYLRILDEDSLYKSNILIEIPEAVKNSREAG
jgi:signal transduction histidine kinase